MYQRKEFERVTPESVGLHSKTIEAYVEALENSSTEMHGLIIMRHGKVCTEGWWAPFAPHIPHGLQSLTKTYAATAVGIAYTEDLVDLDERVIDIFKEEAPADPSENLQKLRVRDVLCMGCGMDEMPHPTKDWIRQFLATPVNHEPGTTYMYNSMGSSLLGAIVRQKTGLGLQEYLTPRLFEKIGIDPDNLGWYYMLDGMEIGGGGLLSTTENNLRLMKLYADGGVWEGERILAEDYVLLATTNQNDSASESKGNPEAWDNFVGYGYQIWMCRPNGVYRADGAMGQFAIVIPSLDMIISINETASGAHWAQNTLNLTWEFLKQLEQDCQNDGYSDVLPENPDAAMHLEKRMRHLAIEAPTYQPYSPCSKRISGEYYIVKEGSVDLKPGMSMSGAAPSEGIRAFQLDFDGMECRIHIEREEKTAELTAALDGSRRWNRMRLEGDPASMVYLSGTWIQEDVFELTARWIETCFESKIEFHVKGERIEISSYPSVGGFGPMLGRGYASAEKR